ncbi:MAG: DUF4118 domain-containing protein [Fusicatenibacter sp.]|nr:DUF4118 domain-containing protein [Lachnospiraceae bacterium]MDY2938675.1 DUF4118 domain-containing protein [Fusicatenibacter sp.]
MQEQIFGDLKEKEHILVCLSTSPSNARIIQTAARLSGVFCGELTALYVETPSYQHAAAEDKERLKANMHLAREQGASVVTVYGEDVPFQIAEYAKKSHVTRLVIGRSSQRRRAFPSIKRFTERLIEYVPDVDIYIIPDNPGKRRRNWLHYIANHQFHLTKEKFSPLNTVKTLLVMLLATGVGLFFHRAGLRESNIILIYILGVLITAVITSGRTYSIVSSLFSVLLFNFFFTEPRYTFAAYSKEYPVTFLVMFLAAVLCGSLTAKIKRQAVASAEMAYRTRVLLDTNQLLQQEKNEEGILRACSCQLIKLLQRSIIYYAERNGKLEVPVFFEAEGKEAEKELCLTGTERETALWTWENNRRSGASTDVRQNAYCIYYTVRGSENIYGVVGIALGDEQLNTLETSLMLSILGECGMALEKTRFAKMQQEAEAQARSEQLRANLLRSISHDLRTPLTGIAGNASMLMNSEFPLTEEKKQGIYGDIYEDAMWLTELVENLLSITRMQDTTMQLKLKTELVSEVIAEALSHVSRKSKAYQISVQEQDEFLLARMDANLIVQVLINLIDNALKYTPEGSEITISTFPGPDEGIVTICVADNGPGIPDEAKPHIFEMFYTAASGIPDGRRSMGLGLALCRSIVTAHGGTIQVTDAKEHGAVFTFTLPAAQWQDEPQCR